MSLPDALLQVKNVSRGGRVSDHVFRGLAGALSAPANLGMPRLRDEERLARGPKAGAGVGRDCVGSSFELLKNRKVLGKPVLARSNLRRAVSNSSAAFWPGIGMLFPRRCLTKAASAGTSISDSNGLLKSNVFRTAKRQVEQLRRRISA